MKHILSTIFLRQSKQIILVAFLDKIFLLAPHKFRSIAQSITLEIPASSSAFDLQQKQRRWQERKKAHFFLSILIKKTSCLK